MLCKLSGCEYEVNHNVNGADSLSDKLNNKTLGLYLVGSHW